MNIKRGDNVTVLTGRDKGKSGKVLKVFPKSHCIVVEGVNEKKKHQKPRRTSQKGQIITVAMPIDVSNVMVKK